jgi:hypothetical protein
LHFHAEETMLHDYFRQNPAGQAAITFPVVSAGPAGSPLLPDPSRAPAAGALALLPQGDATSEYSDFQNVIDRRSQDIPSSPPGLVGRHQQLDAQRRCLRRDAATVREFPQLLAEALRILFENGIDAGAFFAANAAALSIQARHGDGSSTGREPRVPGAAGRYADSLKDAVLAAATVAGPAAAALLLSRWLVKPVAGVLGEALFGASLTAPRPPEVFYPNPADTYPDGSPRSEAELQAAWRVVRNGRRAVVARQAQSQTGGIRDLACELAHPLAFALQGLALNLRADRPGALTAGGANFGTAISATTAAETALQAIKKSAMFLGIDKTGAPVDMHLFESSESDGSTLAERLRAAPGAMLQAVRQQYRAAAADPVGAAMALASELVRDVAATVALNGSSALVDSLQAAFPRNRGEGEKTGANLGVGLASSAVGVICYRIVSKLIDRQCQRLGDRREADRHGRQFHANWIAEHSREVVALYHQVRGDLARGVPETTADRTVFDGLVEPMTKAYRSRLLRHPTLYRYADQVHPQSLRVDMLADHGLADAKARSTIYLDRLMKLPQEYPEAYAQGSNAPPFVVQMEAASA